MDVGATFGWNALFQIAITLLSIGLAWWCLQAVRLDVLLKQPGSGRAKLLHLMLAVGIGYLFASFIIDYANQTSLLRYLF